MSYTVIVSFSPDREYEIMLHDNDIQGTDKEQARAWLAREFEDLECAPSNPSGKILVLDMILGVAEYGGEERFSKSGEWAKRFAVAVVVALERPVVKVDVANLVVG